MVVEQQQFNLLGKCTFIKAKVKLPFKMPYIMPDEAYFFYVVEGEGTLLGPTKKLKVTARDGVVMQCGNYLFEILNEKVYEYCEIIAIHLRPEVLRIIYKKELPGFIEKLNRVDSVIHYKQEKVELLEHYINSLQFYFENPVLVSKELLQLKIEELILITNIKKNKHGYSF